MRSSVNEQISKIEVRITDSTPRSVVFEYLRDLSFCDFSLLLISMPNPSYPKLSKILPKMASVEIQESWTGCSGVELLKQSMDFVRTTSAVYAEINSRGIRGKKVLDYGCGYGRIARLFYYYVNEDDFYGVDPWDRSIQICHEDGLVKNFLVSKYLPDSLPIKETKFDLIYAFSVFTHLSERAAITSVKTLYQYLEDDGIIVITIRPLEYWDIDKHAGLLNKRKELKARHIQDGFAFLPHNRTPIDGDITYGDTSMTFDWIEKKFPFLEIVKSDYSLSDTHQIYVFLKKRDVVV